jgi:hypothetical protein
MKVGRIAPFAGLGMLSMVLPAVAAPGIPDSPIAPVANPADMQVAQYNATRAINEARGGTFKKPNKAKVSKKKKGDKKYPWGPSKR